MITCETWPQHVVKAGSLQNSRTSNAWKGTSVHGSCLCLRNSLSPKWLEAQGAVGWGEEHCPVHTCWWHCQRQDTGLDGPSDSGQLFLCCKASADRDAEPPHSKELCLTTSFASVFTCANSSWGVLGAWGSYLIDVCLCWDPLRGVNQPLHIGGYGGRVQGAAPSARDRIKHSELSVSKGLRTDR